MTFTSRLYKLAALCFSIGVLNPYQTYSNGCTGSQFTLTYSPLCGCYQFCDGGGSTSLLISDCDELNSLVINWGDGSGSYSIPLVGGRPDPSRLPCHHYPPGGPYTATLRIRGNCHLFGNNDCTKSTQVVIAPTTYSIHADFRADTVCLGNGTSFTDLSFFSTDLVNRTWYYDFGDGTTSSGPYPNPVHQYDSCGVYNTMLVISAGNPCCPVRAYDTIYRRVYVDCPPNTTPNQLGLTDPYIYTSSASVTASEVCLTIATDFTLTKSDSIINWQYAFSDGGASTQQNPSHTFPYCEPYDNHATVTVTNTRGCSDTFLQPVVVHCPILGVFSGVSSVLCYRDCNGTATINALGGVGPYTVSWSDPNLPPTPVAVNLCAGTYTVTISDVYGCADTQSVTITEPPPITGSLSVVNNNCFGGTIGSATVTVSGGTPPFAYSWSPNITDVTPSASGLAAGTYCMTATDQNACTFDTCAVITQPPEITISSNVTSANCGVCDGTITVTASGGSGSYIYAWSNNAGNTPSISNVCGGVYILTVTDANVPGCSEQFAIAVSSIGSQPVTLNVFNASCVTSCNGSATASFSCACTVEWLDNNANVIGSGTSIGSLCPGNYVLRVTNTLDGCQNISNFTVALSNPVAVSLNVKGSCLTNCDGQITANASGGSGTYGYQWYDGSNNPIGTNSATITGLCPGTYFVQVTESGGCSIRDTAIIVNYLVTGSATSVNLNCFGVCTGSIAALGRGGTQPYTYTFQASGGTIVQSGPGRIAGNLCADTYTVTIADANNCAYTIPPVTISEPAAVAVTASSTNAMCYGQCNGSVTVISTTGGFPPYTHQWVNSLYVPITGTSNLCADTYRVRATDANGCQSPWASAVVGQPPALRDSMVIIQPYCGNGGRGCIDLSISGGTGSTYSVVWDGNGGPYITEDICNLLPGTYTATILDVAGCTINDTAVLVQQPPLSIVSIFKPGWMEGGQQSPRDIRCHGDSTGTVVVTITGGLAPYIYQWNDPAATLDTLTTLTDTVRGLPAGTYNVAVTDALGCTDDTVVIVTEPLPLSISHISSDILCFGYSNGSVTLTVTGGVEAPVPDKYIARWIYETDTSIHITDTTLQLTGIPAGQYSVMVLDSYSCNIRDTIMITEPPEIIITDTVRNGTCSGGGSGSISLGISGGTPFQTGEPYTYAWSWSTGSATTKDLTGLSPDSFFVTVTDANSCARLDTAVVVEPAPLAQTIVVHDVICYGDSSGGIDYTVTGGSPFHNGTYMYSWSTSATTQNLTNLPEGTYSVTATDAGGCTIDTSAYVDEPFPLIGQTVADSICIGDSILIDGVWRKTDGLYQETLISHLGCDSVQSINLTVVDSFFSIIDTAICSYERFTIGNSTYNATGIYRDVFQSAGGCDSVIRTVLTVHPPIGAYAEPPVDTFRFGESQGAVITIRANAGITISDYLWTPTEGLDCSTCASVTSAPSEDMIYTIYVTDVNRCRDTTQATVLFEAAVSVYIPNAFTPNDDGINDIFYIYGRGIVKVHLKIFNRWGELIFESTDQTVGWDGTYRGKPMNPGVYAYYTDIEFITGEAPRDYLRYKKGSVTLIR